MKKCGRVRKRCRKDTENCEKDVKVMCKWYERCGRNAEKVRKRCGTSTKEMLERCVSGIEKIFSTVYSKFTIKTYTRN